MRSGLLVATVLAIAIGAASAIAAEPEPEAVTIPLDQIWGFDLPGTRDIAGMPLPEMSKEGPGVNYASLRRKREICIETFRRALTAKPSTEPAQLGIIIPSPLDFRILDRVGFSVAPAVGGNPKFQAMTRNSFQVGGEMTLVFFTHPAAYYTRLRSVVREGNEIVVTYQFEPHATIESTVHFALIPLGKLPVGEYWVKFKQKEIERKYIDAGFLRVPSPQTVVSQQFKFTVWEPPAADKPAPGAVTIPLEAVWAERIQGTRDVRKLEGQPSSDTTEEHIASSRVEQIGHALRPNGEPAKPGFVVPAVDLAALELACNVIAKDVTLTNLIPPDVDATLVFFVNALGHSLILDRIEHEGHAIKVKYHFVHSRTRESGPHLALIPLGKLPSGKYDVSMVRLPTEGEGPEVDPERVKRIVCQDFSFDVAERIEKR